ncbi:hypothetical protein ELY21_01470 [Legionella sp. km535]|uniref:hypothetical protein n=1 Tax=Legionella sp. km535 TaxID=2498107 RepID=UPI000F8C5056|nr:hypothetical protein [Legionella sp. km535]RUR20214.1 hypothetical protein ELY21_01470 [Legionella sp. km535]
MPNFYPVLSMDLYIQTAAMLDEYRSLMNSVLLRNPRYDAVTQIIEKIRSHSYSKFSDLVRDLDLLITDEVPIIFHFDDLLPGLIEQIKEMHKKMLFDARKSGFDVLELYTEPHYTDELLDRINTLHPIDQIQLFNATGLYYFRKSLLIAIATAQESEFPLSKKEQLITHFEKLLAFMCNLLEVTQSIDNSQVQTAHQILLYRLLTNSNTLRLRKLPALTDDNLLIHSIVQLKQIPPSLLRLCEFLGSDLSLLFWNNKVTSRARWTNTFSIQSVLGYALQHAPDSIEELLHTMSRLDLEEQILLVHCAVMGSYIERVYNFDLKTLSTQTPLHDINIDHAVVRFMALQPFLSPLVWTRVLLHQAEKNNSNLFQLIVNDCKFFSDIMNLIKDLPPEYKEPFLVRKISHHTGYTLLEKVIIYKYDPDLVKMVLDAQADLPTQVKARIFSHVPKMSPRNVLIEAGAADSIHMARIRAEIDSLPPEIITKILDQVDVTEINMLMRAVSWDIKSLEWYLAYVDQMPREKQVSVLLHSNVGWVQSISQKDIPEHWGDTALLLALNEIKPKQLTALFNFIFKVIYLDAEHTILDTDTLLKLLKRTNFSGLNALTESLSHQQSPNPAFPWVLKLLQLIPVSMQGELRSILLQNTQTEMNALMLAVENNHLEAIVPLLSLAKNTQPSSLVPWLVQENNQGEHIFMIAIQHSPNTLEILLKELLSLPETEQFALFARLFASTNKSGYNVMHLAAIHCQEAIPLLLPIISLLPPTTQADILCKKIIISNKEYNPLLLAIKKCQNPDRVKAIYNAISDLDKLIPDLLKEVKKPAQEKPYMQYFFQTCPITNKSRSESTPTVFLTGAALSGPST